MSRIVCEFSCGAASAVATRLTLAQHPAADVQIINAFLVEEHEDNRRFLVDCESWFGRKITILRDEKYGASAREVWRRKRFMVNGIWGAPCSIELKRVLLDAFKLPTDRFVFGYFFRDRNTGVRFGLKDLNPDAGRHSEELPSCSFYCVMAERELA